MLGFLISLQMYSSITKTGLPCLDLSSRYIQRSASFRMEPLVILGSKQLWEGDLDLVNAFLLNEYSCAGINKLYGPSRG